MVITRPINSIRQYFDDPGINQSSLKDLQYGVDKLLENASKEFSTKEYMIVGGAVDMILTGEPSDFDSEYYVSKSTVKLSDAEKEITDLVFNNFDVGIANPTLEMFPEIIGEVVTELDWNRHHKMETKIANITKKCESYFQDLILSRGKTVINLETKTKIDSIVRSLRTNPRTSKFFDRNRYENNIHVDIYYQLPIYFYLYEARCKALLDIVIVGRDENSNEVQFIQPIDLKTMSGYTMDFPANAKKYQYTIQAAWYYDALSNPTAIFPEDFPRFSSEAIIAPFIFVVESTTNIGKPLVFQASGQFMDIGRFGKPKFNGGKILGYHDLLKEYIYQMENNWKEDRVVTENDGVLELGYDGITGFNEYGTD